MPSVLGRIQFRLCQLRTLAIASALIASFAGSLATAFTPLNENDLVFVNLDHSPVGALSTLAYGYKGDKCGLGMSSSQFPFRNGGGGVVIALKTGSGLKAMPFVLSTNSVSSTASFFDDAEVQRSLGPCTDDWNVPSAGLSWRHYTPVWKMPSLDAATLAEKKRFFLPATWMTFTVNNTSGVTEDFYFGLPASGSKRSFAGGAYEGFVTGEAALAVKGGECELLSGSALSGHLNGMTTGFAFHLSVPPGESRSLSVLVAFHREAVVDTRLGASCYYKALFGSVDEVIDHGMALLPDVRTRCQQLADTMDNAGLNPFRRFLACQTLHSYHASTLCLREDSTGKILWRELEGEYMYINTFDLTVDHVFYNALMHPWVIRNVLDTYSGASNGGEGYTYDHPLYAPSDFSVVSPTGFSFHHDMGRYLTTDPPDLDPTGYESRYSYMAQEQLQNFLLCAALYWKRSGDNAWLADNRSVLETCLDSMMLRDDVTPANRDGITDFINIRTIEHKEITTYDALDNSLNLPDQSGRTTVRSWAVYLGLREMFTQLGDSTRATTSATMAGHCATAISDKWDAYGPTLGYLPARLDGSNMAAVTPILEGLAFTREMGIPNASSLAGPFGSMLQDLKSHMTNILVPGRCLDAITGAWRLTSSHSNSWQSKIYLCQFVAEEILEMNGATINGSIDQVHATLQIQQAPYQGWTDQLSSDGGNSRGSLHYPRGITNILWWLTPETNQGFPTADNVPGAPTGLTARTGTGRVLLNWESPGQTSSFNVRRSRSLSGPYVTLATGVTGASFIDYSTVTTGTYHYTISAVNPIGEGVPSSPASVNVVFGSLPEGWQGVDIGAVGMEGGDSYSPEANAFGLEGSGADITGTTDAFHFVQTTLTGDFSISARVVSLGDSDPWAKAGIMFRDTAASDSANAAIVITPSRGVSFQWRSSAGGGTNYMPNPYDAGTTVPCYLKLTRTGDILTGYRSPDGVNWTTVGSAVVSMVGDVLAGFAVCSHDETALTHAALDKVLLTALPTGWSTRDIGSPPLAGATYQLPSGNFVVSGCGADIYGSNDVFRYLYRTASGDCSIVTKVDSLTPTDAWAKTGLMIRNSTSANAANAAILITPTRGVSFQWRSSNGGGTTFTPNPYVADMTTPCYLRLTRKGNVITAMRSPDGVTWATVGSATVNLSTDALIGPAVTSHNTTALNTASFSQVAVTSSKSLHWRELHFSSTDLPDMSKESTVWGDYADPDGDHLVNIIEFALLGDPNSGGTLPAQSTEAGEDEFAMIYHRSTEAMSELDCQPECSTSMLGFWTTAGVTERILSDDGTVQQVRASTPMDGSMKFLRLKIQRQQP